MPDEPKVFLCHNTKEKPEINKIRAFLESRNVSTFMDQYDFEPFSLWKKRLEAEIKNFKTAAIFLGKSGLGSYQAKEIDMFVDELNKNSKDRRVGLVILPGCSDELRGEVTKKWSDLSKWQWTDFHQDEPDPVKSLISGVSSIQVGVDLNLKQSLINQRENRQLRAELFQIVAGDFQEEAKRLVETIDREKARILEINKKIARIVLELEDVDPRLKSVEKIFRERTSNFAKTASQFAFSDSPEFKAKNKSLEFQNSLDCFQTEIEIYIDRIGMFLVTSDLQFLHTPVHHESGFSSELYIKALDHIKEMVLDFSLEPEIFKVIENCIDALNRVVKYQ